MPDKEIKETKPATKDDNKIDIYSYMHKDDETNTICLRIPCDELFLVFTPYAIERLINNNSTAEIEQELNKYGVKHKARAGVLDDDGYLELSWADDKKDELSMYKKEFPSPIPTLYQIPIKVLQTLLHTDKYRVTIDIKDNALVMRRSIAGVFKETDIVLPELNLAVAKATGVRVKYVRTINRECIFRVV